MPLDSTHITQREFSQFLSVDSAKAIKAREYGYLNGINYMAPAATAGVGNLCPNASPGCLALCLGWYSGRAAMVPGAELDTGSNSVRDNRRAKAQLFMHDRANYLSQMTLATAKLVAKATRENLTPCMRPNGATDIAYEGIAFSVDPTLAARISRLIGREFKPGRYASIMAAFPEVQFVDYTKNTRRMRRRLPTNYHLTFSRSETNDVDAVALLVEGHNVAVVFRHALPPTWQGFAVVDGDKHDLRHLDPRGGFVIGLLPKGSRAKRDQSGFVVG